MINLFLISKKIIHLIVVILNFMESKNSLKISIKLNYLDIIVKNKYLKEIKKSNNQNNNISSIKQNKHKDNYY